MTVQMPNLALTETKWITVQSMLWEKQEWQHFVHVTNIAFGYGVPLEQYSFMVVGL